MAKKKNRFRGTIRIGGKLIQCSFATKADRDDWYIKMRQQKLRAKAGLETDFEPIEFERIAADFIVSRMNLETWKHDKYRIETYFFPVFQGRMIHTITRKEWKDEMEKLITVHGLKPKTYNNIRTMLSSLYNYAIKDEPRRAIQNPISEIPALPVMQEEIQFFHSKEECQKYLTHSTVVHPMFGMFATIALNTGMREGEIQALDWASVSLSDKFAKGIGGGSLRVRRIISHSTGQIVNRTKGKKERVIGINRTLWEAFKRHKAWTPFNKPEDLVICTRTGHHFTTGHLQELHAKAIKAAGLHYIVIHGLRHTFATNFLAHGGDIYSLKNILGHASIKTTERYSHIIPVRMQAQANVFEVSASDATVMHKKVGVR